MAFRVAAEPPLVNTPPAVSGMPSHSRNQSSTTSSTWLGPADSSHVPWKTLKPPVSMCARKLGQVGEEGMKAKKRG